MLGVKVKKLNIYLEELKKLITLCKHINIERSNTEILKKNLTFGYFHTFSRISAHPNGILVCAYSIVCGNFKDYVK